MNEFNKAGAGITGSHKDTLQQSDNAWIVVPEVKNKLAAIFDRPCSSQGPETPSSPTHESDDCGCNGTSPDSYNGGNDSPGPGNTPPGPNGNSSEYPSGESRKTIPRSFRIPNTP